MRAFAVVLTACVLALSVASCGGNAGARPQVTIEPLPSATPPAVKAVGGKPAAPPTATAPAAATVTPEAPAVSPTEEATPDGRASSAAEATPAPDLVPKTGRWIDVDVTRLGVRLMDGASVVQEIAPVAVGAKVDTGEYASTQTGLFHVYNKIADLAYDPPYDTYISDWVGFDPEKANGFHSFLKNETGKVVDAATGRISNGCIRTGAERAIFAFAEIGMPVYVHT